MRLKKLTEEDMRNAGAKKLCCYEKSTPHLTELCDKYAAAGQICLIVDDSVRQRGEYYLSGHKFEVQAPEVLEELDWSDKMLVITSDFHREAYEKLCRMETVVQSLETVYYFADRETEYEDEYREYYKKRDLENILVFRSGPYALSYVKEMDFADNARALFEYMLEEGYNEKYRLVWFVKDPLEFPQYQGIKNVEFLSFEWSVSERKEERDKYYEALCLAKFFFLTDAYGFARNCREDQIRVQLWHGSGFKTRVNFVRCEKRYDYMTVTGDIYKEVYQDIFGLREDQMLVTGYAKGDWVFHPIKGDYRKRLQIPEADQYIYWLPTFRTGAEAFSYLSEEGLYSETGFPIADTRRKLDELNDLLMQKEIVLVIKLHPIQDRSVIGDVEYSNIVLLDNRQLFREDIQINRILADADALISDYSSAAVDYMLLDRPIAFTLDDVEAYEESRGFLFHPIRDWLPGVELDSFEDMKRFIGEVADGIDVSKEKRHRLQRKMHTYSDDKSCERILKTLGIERG